MLFVAMIFQWLIIKNWRMRIFLIFLLNSANVFTALSSNINNQDTMTPWFTGPFLAPTPVNTPIQHPIVQPSFTIFNISDTYNAHWKSQKEPNIVVLNPTLNIDFGITETLGVELIVSTISNFQNKKTFTSMQDSFLLLGYQVSNDIKNSWVPDFRIYIQELFPTGNYQKFHKQKTAIEATGQGSFQTGPLLAFRKIFYLSQRYFALWWGSGVLFPSQARVHGFNTYGGGPKTSGKVRPGKTLTLVISGEYSISQQWVFAFDSEFLYQGKSHFSGKKGLATTVCLPSAMQISLAPEIEYNFNAQSGLLLGCWKTLFGKNSNDFLAVFISYLKEF